MGSMATTKTAPRRTGAAAGLIDVPTLAQRLGIQVSFVRKLVDQRRIPFIRIGRLIRFDPDEVDGWLVSNRVETIADAAWRRRNRGGARA
jgi:excisionase family DNA binding protein